MMIDLEFPIEKSCLVNLANCPLRACLVGSLKTRSIIVYAFMGLNCTLFCPLDLHTRLKNARSSDGTTDSIGDIMLNWVGGKKA